MLQQWQSHLLYFNPGFCLMCVCVCHSDLNTHMAAPLNSLLKDWNRGGGKKGKKNKGLIRIIAEQLLKSINLVPLQKIIFGQEDHKQYSPKLETKRRGLGAECAYHC